jgi:polysaccharide export outer membrane protein
MRIFLWPLSALIVALALAAQEPPAATSAVGAEPGDLIAIEVWREEDLSGEFLVDEDGRVTLPLLGVRQVTGMPIAEMKDSLLAGYRRSLRNESITITPLRRVFVLGEVNEPGLLAVDPTVSLAAAVALAGGASNSGDLRRIRVIRGGAVYLDNVSAESALASVDVRSGDQIFVGRRGWFDRNSTFVVSALLSITSLIVTLLR